MKNKIFIVTLLWTKILLSQNLTFSDKYDSNDFSESLEMLGLKLFKYQMPKELKGCYFDLIIKEYYDGTLINEVRYSEKVSNMKQVLLWQSNIDSYTMKINTLKNDTVETFNARLPGMDIKNYGLGLKMSRNEYAWESLIEENKKIDLNTEIPILTFASKPSKYHHQKLAAYCELENYNYTDWYSRLNVKHYFIILTKITKN